jgi:hypothetical protein
MENQQIILKKEKRKPRRPREKLVKTVLLEEQTGQLMQTKKKRRRRNKKYRFDTFRKATPEQGSKVQTFMNKYGFNPYLAMLINPKEYAMRYPDEFGRTSALYSSYQYFNVTGNNAVTSAPGDVGKFCFIIRPVISSTVANFAGGAPYNTVTYYNPNVIWGDFTAASSYVIAQDPNSVALIGAPNAGLTGFTSLGLIQTYRPIAMSVWFQSTASALLDGGDVSAALVDGTVIPNLYGSTPPAPGYLQEYDNLAKVPCAYEGKIKEGTYTFWKPTSNDDTEFYAPFGVVETDNNTISAEEQNYPTIVVSGQSQNNASNIVGRVEIITIYEYMTTSRLVESKPSVVDTRMVTQARAIVQKLCTSMSNEEHKTFIQEVLGLLGSAAKGAAKSIGPKLLDMVLELI